MILMPTLRVAGRVRLVRHVVLATIQGGSGRKVSALGCAIPARDVLASQRRPLIRSAGAQDFPFARLKMCGRLGLAHLCGAN